MCCAASIAAQKVGKWQTPSTLSVSTGESRISMRSRTASVPSEPTSKIVQAQRPVSGAPARRCCSRRPGADLGEAGGDLVRLARAQRREITDQRIVGLAVGSANRCARLPIGHQRVDGDSTLSRISPYLMDREPQELFAAIPPMVAREAVETSTGNHSPCGLQHRGSARPARCPARPPHGGSARPVRSPFRCREKSTTTPELIVCPAWDWCRRRAPSRERPLARGIGKRRLDILEPASAPRRLPG